MKNTNKFGYASFLERLAAFIIDAFIIGLISSLFAGVGGANLSKDHINYNSLGLGSLASIAYILYFWIYQDGQTLGKKMLKIKVVTISGKPIDFGVAIIRYIGYLLSTILFYLGYIWVIFDPNKQSWHDKLAGTFVVKTDSSKNTKLIIIALSVLGFLFFSLFIILFMLVLGGVVLFGKISNKPDLMEKLNQTILEMEKTDMQYPEGTPFRLKSGQEL